MEFLNIGVSTVKDGAGGHYTEEELKAVLRVYRGLSVRAIEFSHVFDMTGDSAARIGDTCRRLGMVPWSVHLRGITPDREASRRTVSHDLLMAHKLGATVCVLHAIGEPEQGDKYLENYREVSEIAAQYGLLVAIETGTLRIGKTTGSDHETLIRLVDAIDRPNVGVNIDMGHSALCDPTPVADIVRHVGDRLFTLHCQDNFGQRDDHQAPGIGLTDWRSVLKALKESSYSGPFLMELTDCGKANRAIGTLGGFVMPIEEEIAGASAWISYLWSTL